MAKHRNGPTSTSSSPSRATTAASSTWPPAGQPTGCNLEPHICLIWGWTPASESVIAVLATAIKAASTEPQSWCPGRRRAGNRPDCSAARKEAAGRGTSRHRRRLKSPVAPSASLSSQTCRRCHRISGSSGGAFRPRRSIHNLYRAVVDIRGVDRRGHAESRSSRTRETRPARMGPAQSVSGGCCHCRRAAGDRTCR